MQPAAILAVLLLCVAALSTTKARTMSYAEATERILVSIRSPESKSVRPFGTDGDSADNVTLSYELYSLNFLDTVSGELELTGYLGMKWRDERLDFSRVYTGETDIKYVRIASDDIWTPDIELYNAAGPGMRTLTWSRPSVVAVVMKDGTVLMYPQVTSTSSCDVTDREADRYVCQLKFGSWSYNGDEVDLHAEGFDTSEYIPNPKWNLVSNSTERQLKYYPCCPEPYVNIVFSLELERI